MQRAISLAASGGKPFHLQLTGGEPTLVLESIEKAVVLSRKSGLCKSLALQTNATCITPELLEMLKLHQIQVGVSLDGPPMIHEQLRGRVSETLRGISLLDREKIPFQVTTVVSQANAPYLDQLVLLLAGFSYVKGIGLDLLIQKGRAKNTPNLSHANKITLEEGVIRMITTLDAITIRRKTPIRLREWDLTVSSGKKSPVFCHACKGESMAVLPDGRIFPCGQTLGDSLFGAGTVWEVQPDRLNRLHACKPLNALCHDCPLGTSCPGECPSRLHYNQDHHAGRACDLYRILWRIENESR